MLGDHLRSRWRPRRQCPPIRKRFPASKEARRYEAVVADSRRGAAKVLGLDSFLGAPRLEANDWVRMAARQADQLRDSVRATGTVVLAVPADGGLHLERPIGPRVPLEAFGADGSLLGHALTGADDQVLMNASATIRDGSQTLRGIGHKPSRAPRPGDLVILGSTLDPRVRIALEVEPSDRSSDKITVFDLESEDLERKVLASHVKCVGWLESEVVPRMVTGA